MPKTDIKELVEESKKQLEQDSKKFTESIKTDLDSFKKKALGQ